MSKLKHKKIIYCNRCMSCKHDCKIREDVNKCENYEMAMPLHEINELVREQNVNLRKLCKNKNLKFHILMDMLKGKMNFTYKYYYYLVTERLTKDAEWMEYESYFEGGEGD